MSTADSAAWINRAKRTIRRGRSTPRGAVGVRRRACFLSPCFTPVDGWSHIGRRRHTLRSMQDIGGETIQLRDGRRLGYAEWGDPSGQPLLYFHGFPWM
jgi:hypothetical protein